MMTELRSLLVARIIARKLFKVRKDCASMDRIELMSVVVSIAEAGSLSAASRKLRMPVPTVSRKLSELEARLKTQLFQRSSRRVSLTDAGRSYVEACKRIIEQVDDAEKEASGEYRAPTGDLTVTSPWGVGHLHLLPLSCEFEKAYPNIALRLLLSDRVLDPVEYGIDIAVRIGPLASSAMIATRIGSVRVVACASPEYLEKPGVDRRRRPTSSITTALGSMRPECRTIGNSRRTALKSRRPFDRGSPSALQRLRCRRQSSARGSPALCLTRWRLLGGRARSSSFWRNSRENRCLMHIVYTERKPMPLKLRVFLDWMTPRLKARLAPYVG